MALLVDLIAGALKYYCGEKKNFEAQLEKIGGSSKNMRELLSILKGGTDNSENAYSDYQALIIAPRQKHFEEAEKVEEKIKAFEKAIKLLENEKKKYE